MSFFLLVMSRLHKELGYLQRKSATVGLDFCASALVVPVTAGFFNTPFYQEPAMLAMMLMGAMFSAQGRVKLLIPAVFL